jgi:hypothetical protein
MRAGLGWGQCEWRPALAFQVAVGGLFALLVAGLSWRLRDVVDGYGIKRECLTRSAHTRARSRATCATLSGRPRSACIGCVYAPAFVVLSEHPQTFRDHFPFHHLVSMLFVQAMILVALGMPLLTRCRPLVRVAARSLVVTATALCQMANCGRASTAGSDAQGGQFELHA